MIKTFCPLSFWSCLKFQIYKRKRACICYFQIAHFAPQKFASPGFAWPWFSTSLDTIDEGFVCRIIPTLITSRPTSKASSLFSFFVLYLWYGVGDLTPHRNHYPCGNVLAVIHFYRHLLLAKCSRVLSSIALLRKTTQAESLGFWRFWAPEIAHALKLLSSISSRQRA